MAKKFMINCATCDARKVTEETLAAYESVVINAATVLVSPEGKELLNRYGVTMNCANVFELPSDVEVCTVNGSHRIESSDAVGGRKHLFVNGSLTIGPNTQQVMEQYVGITVNGSLTCPESVSASLGKIQVNGSTTCYPDGAIILKRSAVIDKLFALRAKESLYWSSRRMIMVDPLLEPEKLTAKGCTFSAKEMILAESKVEDMIGMIDEKADIIIVPDGTAVITDDVELDDMTVKKFGTKLYILGDLEVDEESAAALEQLEYLNVRGDAKVTAELKALLMEKLTEISGNMEVPKPFKGRVISEKMSVRVTRWLLEREPDGLRLEECVNVKIDEDVPKELILERLSITEAVSVKCSPEQEDAVVAICEEVVSVGQGEDGMGVGDMIKGAFGAAKDLLNTKMVNASDYVL